MSLLPTRPRGKQASGYQREYLMNLIKDKGEFSAYNIRHNLLALLTRVCPQPVLAFRIGDSVESALYMLDTNEASHLIKLLGGRKDA
jgi:hypothetical protein